MALIFQDGAEFGVVQEAALDGGLEHEPGTLKLIDLAVGAADGEGLVKRDHEFGVTLAQDLEHLHDTCRVEFFAASVDPQEHAGNVTLVFPAVVCVGEQGVKVLLCLIHLAVVEPFCGEFEVLSTVHLVRILALLTRAQDLEFAFLADTHAAAIEGVAKDSRKDAVGSRNMGNQFVADAADVAGFEVDTDRRAIDLGSFEIANQRAFDQ